MYAWVCYWISMTKLSVRITKDRRDCITTLIILRNSIEKNIPPSLHKDVMRFLIKYRWNRACINNSTISCVSTILELMCTVTKIDRFARVFEHLLTYFTLWSTQNYFTSRKVHDLVKRKYTDLRRILLYMQSSIYGGGL